ncbi:MAG: hypothetical protein KatS3mg096_747 [Candidatus Parcubacteria bacterium]|nr:MAG: hypothetical protein KatS3mg096_747 [Candidatus Parcubacteria bacterium]
MILSQVFQKVRRLTNTTSSTLTDVRLLDLVNEVYLEIQRTLADNEIEVLGGIVKTDLIANQPNYQLPSDLLTILRVEVNYDDPTDNTKWIKASETDLANLPYEWYNLLKSQPKSKPLYDLFSNTLWLFPQPTANQTQGLRLWYIVRQQDFTSVNDTLHPVLDKYWDVLAMGTAQKYLEEIGHPLSQRRFELYQLGLQKMVDDLKTEVIEPIKMQPIDYFNSGWV